MANTTNHKWEMKTLEMCFTTKTVELLFPDILKFVQSNNYRFLQNLPAILVSINEDRLSVSQINQIKQLIDQQAEAEKLAAEAAERDAEYDRKTAASRAAYGLTGSHR